MLRSINPYTNALIEEHTEDAESVIQTKLLQSDTAFSYWKNISIEARAYILKDIAKRLLEEKHTFANMITEEMGKPISESILEIEKSAWVCTYYAENAAQTLSPTYPKTESYKNIVRYEPMGVLLAIMPWNFPFWQVFRCFAPNVMAGNTMLLKHASNVQQCAKAIEHLITRCYDYPLLTNICISSKSVDHIIRNSIVKGITLTGSEHAGMMVAHSSGHAIKKSVLELGGSDAFIVLKDADITKAVKHAILGRFLNAGQSCIAAKRFFIEEVVYESFIQAFTDQMNQLICGDPKEPNTQIGPLAKPEFYTELHQHLQQLKSEGGNIVQAKTPSPYIFPPTLVTDLPKHSIVHSTELFGPIACVFRVSGPEEAIELTNYSPYGLSSSLWTADIEKAIKLSEQIEAGAVFINQFSKSDPRLPFGGIKKSGYGRELGDEGLKEFVNVKTVSIEN
mgnify:CR=1 FL=1